MLLPSVAMFLSSPVVINGYDGGSKLGAINKKRQGKYRKKYVFSDGLTSIGEAPNTVSPRLSRRIQRGTVLPELHPQTCTNSHSKTNTYLKNGFTSVGVERFMSPHRNSGGATAIASSIYSGKGKGSSGLPELDRGVGYGTTSCLASEASRHVLLGDHPEGRTARNIHLHLRPGRELRHTVDRHLKDVSIVYNKPPRKLPTLNQLTLQTHRLRYMANADYQFFGDKGRTLRPESKEAVDTPPTVRHCPRETISKPSSPTMLSMLESPAGRLRRPTVAVARPLAQSNADFVALANKAILSPIVIEKCAKQTMLFYATHYPLLLRTPLREDPDVDAASREDFSPRRERIRKRIRQMDKYIDELVIDDSSITTELKSDTFNPAKWDIY